MKIERKFIPGSKWLYFKIYSGEVCCDRLLVEVIMPFVRYCKRKGWVRQWFFIRYFDYGFHLRVRFEMTDISFTGELMTAFGKKLKKYITDGIISSLAVDTYIREIERYGSNEMEVTESLFCIDSNCIIETIFYYTKIGRDRDIVAFLLVDSFMDAFGLSLEEKLRIVEKLDVEYQKEFGFNRHNMRQLNQRYRQLRDSIINIIERYGEEMPEMADVIARRDKMLVKLNLERYGNLNIASLLHMMMNRLFVSKNRLSEMVVYNFLMRYYKSKIARIMMGK